MKIALFLVSIVVVLGITFFVLPSDVEEPYPVSIESPTDVSAVEKQSVYLETKALNGSSDTLNQPALAEQGIVPLQAPVSQVIDTGDETVAVDSDEEAANVFDLPESERRQYMIALSGAYEYAKATGDEGLLAEAREYYAELGIKEDENGRLDFSEYLKKLSGDDKVSFDVAYDDCGHEITYGQFKCPCPSDTNYNENWRDNYNPLFLEEQQCVH